MKETNPQKMKVICLDCSWSRPDPHRNIRECGACGTWMVEHLDEAGSAWANGTQYEISSGTRGK